MSVASVVAKIAAPLVIDAVGDSLKDLSADDIMSILRVVSGGGGGGGGGMPPINSMYGDGMYSGNNGLPATRGTGQLVPKGLTDLVNSSGNSLAKGKDKAEDAVLVNDNGSGGGGMPPDNANGGKTNTNEKEPYDKKKYMPSAVSQLINKYVLPIAGDIASVAGNTSGIANSMLGQMLAATADSRNTQSAYSNLIPKQFSTGGNIAAALYNGNGMIGKTIGDTVNSRLQEIAATNWAQDMQDANRRFYIDYEPNNGQQEYEARLLTSAKNKVERSTGSQGTTSDTRVKTVRDNSLRRPGADDVLSESVDTAILPRGRDRYRLRRPGKGGYNDES